MNRLWHFLRLFFHRPTEECPDMECELCSERDCAFGDPLHYHHDGCPTEDSPDSFLV